jgi:hypothetical protein
MVLICSAQEWILLQACLNTVMNIWLPTGHGNCRLCGHFFFVNKGFAMCNYMYILIICLFLFIGYLIVIILSHVCLCIAQGSGIKVLVLGLCYVKVVHIYSIDSLFSRLWNFLMYLCL